MRLAHEGWWGGDPEKIMQAPADLVLAAAQYQIFKGAFDRAYIELNKEKT